MDVANIQWEEIKSHAGSLQSYIFADNKTKYNKQWNHNSVRVLFHLSHWIEMKAGWHRSDMSYADTDGDLGKILYKYLYTTNTTNSGVKNASHSIEGNIYSWNTSYDILGRLGQFCNGAGLTKLNSLWGSSFKIEVDFVKDINSVKRAYKSGTINYLSNSNCVIIEKNTPNLIITKLVNNIAETLEYVTLEKK